MGTEDIINEYLERTYEVQVKCTNCGANKPIRFPKKVRITEFPCPDCGCKKLINT